MAESNKSNIKRVKVSKQRQVNIPKEFYDNLNSSKEVQIEFTGNAMIIIPVKEVEVVDFSEYILKDVLTEGHTGEAILKRFKEIKEQLPKALEQLIEDSKSGGPPYDGDLYSYLDSFEDDEEHE